MRRLIFIIILILLPSSVFAKEKNPAYLIGMQVNPSPEMSRITFILTKKVPGIIKYVSHLNQMTVEFHHTQKRITIQELKLRGSNIALISSEQHKDQTLTFMIKVNRPVKWTMQYLSDYHSRQARLQLEIISVKVNAQSKRSLLLQKDILKTIALLSRKNNVKREYIYLT